MSSCALLHRHCHQRVLLLPPSLDDLFQSPEEEDELVVEAGEVEADEVVMDSA